MGQWTSQGQNLAQQGPNMAGVTAAPRSTASTNPIASLGNYGMQDYMAAKHPLLASMMQQGGGQGAKGQLGQGGSGLGNFGGSGGMSQAPTALGGGMAQPGGGIVGGLGANMSQDPAMSSNILMQLLRGVV